MSKKCILETEGEFARMRELPSARRDESIGPGEIARNEEADYGHDQ
jgi:hypothetical protein